MYSGDVNEFEDMFPEWNERLKEFGYRVFIEHGFKCFEWSLLSTKPFGQQIEEFITWYRVGTGKSNTPRDAYLLALSTVGDLEHDFNIYHYVLFGVVPSATGKT